MNDDSKKSSQPAAPETFQVSFEESTNKTALFLNAGANLSEHLDMQNSPVLFGCRTGICGTCLIEVTEVSLSENLATHPTLHGLTENEIDLLPLLAPGNLNARLACQIKLNANIKVKPLESI